MVRGVFGGARPPPPTRAEPARSQAQCHHVRAAVSLVGRERPQSASADLGRSINILTLSVIRFIIIINMLL